MPGVFDHFGEGRREDKLLLTIRHGSASRTLLPIVEMSHEPSVFSQTHVLVAGSLSADVEPDRAGSSTPASG